MLRRPLHLVMALCAVMLLGLTTTSTSPASGTTSTNPISYVGGSRATATVRAPSVKVPTSVQAGDTLLLTASLGSPKTLQVSAGWTLVGDQSAGSLRSLVWSRTATSSDAGSSATITMDATYKSALTITAFRGVDPSVPLAAKASTDANTSSHTTPAVTVPAGAWVVSYWSDKGPSTTKWTTPSTVTSRVSAYSTGTGRVSASVADFNGPRSGAVPGVTATTDAKSARAVSWAVTLPARNLPPVAEFSQNCADLKCDFDASASTDPDGTVANQAWDFGDGATASGQTVSHAFAAAGTYPAQLTVTDDRGATAQKMVSVTVTAPPSATRFGFWAGTDQLGDTGSARSDFDRVSSYLGTPDVYRMFYPGLPEANFVGSKADFGPPVVVSFKANPADVIAGKDDAYLSSWFASIPTTRKVWWSYWHEPEDDIERGAFTAADYRAAWKHILALAPHRDTLLPVVILMNYSNYKTSRNIADYVPNDPNLHGLFWDSYLTGTTKSIDGVIAKPKAVSDSFGLAFGICEVSVAQGFSYAGESHDQTVDEFVPQLLSAARGAKAEVVSWFETNKSDGDWRMRPYSPATSAWVTR